MIDTYTEIAQILSNVDGLSRADIAPAGEPTNNVYPAAYIAIDELKPLETLGNSNGTASVIFTVEYRLMPYDGTHPEQNSLLNELAPYLRIVENARKAMLKHQGTYVYNTTLIIEKMDTEVAGCYVVKQQWTCLSHLWSTNLQPMPNLPIELEIE